MVLIALLVTPACDMFFFLCYVATRMFQVPQEILTIYDDGVRFVAPVPRDCHLSAVRCYAAAYIYLICLWVSL